MPPTSSAPTALLAATVPATAADTRDREQMSQAVVTAEDAQAREIETLAHLTDPHVPALTALRQRILARFTELEGARTAIGK